MELVRCNPMLDENACGLVQLRHTFPADIMYADYWYVSGVNQTMRDALADITASAMRFVSVAKGDVALDIRCNDGTLLRSYKDPGLARVGFDPAKNFLGAQDEGFQRINDYFNKASYVTALGTRKAKIVTSIAMFYDLEDPVSFTKDVHDVMADDGIWILQMADLPTMLRHNMFDNICHEHLIYYHLAPMEFLLKRCGMKLVDIEFNAINGSSYRFYIRKAVGPGSLSSRIPLERGTFYAASKHALNGFSASMVHQLHRHGIKVCTIYLGAFIDDPAKSDWKMPADEVFRACEYAINAHPRAFVEQIVVRPVRWPD